MELSEIRQEINKIDSELIPILEKRMKLSRQVAIYKKARGIPILNSAREQEILDSVAASVDEDISKYMMELYKQIMRVSREYQAEIMEE